MAKMKNNNQLNKIWLENESWRKYSMAAGVMSMKIIYSMKISNK
jgi:hypothetical protein